MDPDIQIIDEMNSSSISSKSIIQKLPLAETPLLENANNNDCLSDEAFKAENLHQTADNDIMIEDEYTDIQTIDTGSESESLDWDIISESLEDYSSGDILTSDDNKLPSILEKSISQDNEISKTSKDQIDMLIRENNMLKDSNNELGRQLTEANWKINDIATENLIFKKEFERFENQKIGQINETSSTEIRNDVLKEEIAISKEFEFSEKEENDFLSIDPKQNDDIDDLAREIDLFKKQDEYIQNDELRQRELHTQVDEKPITALNEEIKYNRELVDSSSNAENNSLNSENCALKLKIDSLQSIIDTFEFARITVFRALEMEKLKEKNEALENKREIIERENYYLMKEIDRFEYEIQRFMKEIDRFEYEIQRLMNQNNQVEYLNGIYLLNIERFQSEIEDFAIKITSLKNDKKELEDENFVLKMKFKEIQENKQYPETESADLSIEKDNLEVESIYPKDEQIRASKNDLPQKAKEKIQEENKKFGDEQHDCEDTTVFLDDKKVDDLQIRIKDLQENERYAEIESVDSTIQTDFVEFLPIFSKDELQQETKVKFQEENKKLGKEKYDFENKIAFPEDENDDILQMKIEYLQNDDQYADIESVNLTIKTDCVKIRPLLSKEENICDSTEQFHQKPQEENENFEEEEQDFENATFFLNDKRDDFLQMQFEDFHDNERYNEIKSIDLTIKTDCVEVKPMCPKDGNICALKDELQQEAKDITQEENEEFDEKEHDFENVTVYLIDKRDDIKVEIDELKEKIDELKNNENLIAFDIDCLKSIKKSVKKSTIAIKNVQNLFQMQKDKVEEEKSLILQNIAELKIQRDELRNKYLKFIGEANDKTDAKEIEQDKLGDETPDFAKEIISLEEEKVILRDRIDFLKNKIDKLKDKRDYLRHEIKELKVEKYELQNHNDHFEEGNLCLEREVSDITKERTTLAFEIGLLNRALRGTSIVTKVFDAIQEFLF